MRAQAPVLEGGYGMYQVFGHDDVLAVLSDPVRFSSDLSVLMPGMESFCEGKLTMTDPPAHRKLRTLVGRAFTARRISRLEPRIRQLAAELVDGVDGRIELVDQVAHPLPVILIAELLGIPVTDRASFRDWADRLITMQVDSPGDPAFMAKVQETLQGMDGYLAEQCADRRRTPRDDLLSDLLAAEVDGERLTERNVLDTAALLLLAGHITTTLLIGNLVTALTAETDALAAVRADPTLAEAAVDEALRYRPSFPSASRVSTENVTVGGCRITAGRFVMAWLLSANHDERRYLHPDRFDLHRGQDGRHLTFGHGIHFCLGAPLARLEATVVLQVLLERFAELAPDPSNPVEFYESGVLGPRRLPLLVNAVRS